MIRLFRWFWDLPDEVKMCVMFVLIMAVFIPLMVAGDSKRIAAIEAKYGSVERMHMERCRNSCAPYSSSYNDDRGGTCTCHMPPVSPNP